MGMAQQVGLNHPSFGYGQAWFTFALINSSGILIRLLMVEAKNPWAIQTLERIVLEDGKVSPTCELLSVAKHCTELDTRSETTVKVKYVDFLLDIVEPRRLIKDALVATAFDKSLTPDERRYAEVKMAAIIKADEAAQDLTRVASPGSPPPRYPLPRQELALDPTPAPVFCKPSPVQTTVPRFDPNDSIAYQSILAALMDLGFKRAQVKKVLDSMGSKVDQASIEDSIRSALQQLQLA
jgi:hypothetical protein